MGVGCVEKLGVGGGLGTLGGAGLLTGSGILFVATGVLLGGGGAGPDVRRIVPVDGFGTGREVMLV